MILQLIQIFLISLGFHNTGNNTPKNSLYRQQPVKEYQPAFFNNPLLFIIIFVGGIIIFTLLVFLLVPPVESGVVYNQFNQTI